MRIMAQLLGFSILVPFKLKNLFHFDFAHRLINAFLGYLFIIYSNYLGGNVNDYVMLTPVASISSLFFDFGRVELTSKYGLSNTEISQIKSEITTIFITGLLILLISKWIVFISNYYIICLSLLINGAVQIPIDCIIRFYALKKNSILRLYFYQTGCIVSGLSIIFTYSVFKLELLTLLLTLTFSNTIVFLIVYGPVVPFLEDTSYYAVRSLKNHSMRLRSIIFKITPSFIYLFFYMVSQQLDDTILQNFNRSAFFFFGFLQVRLLLKDVNLPEGLVFSSILTGSAILSFPILFFSKHMEKIFVMEPAEYAISFSLILVSSFCYTVQLIFYGKFIRKI